MKMCNDALCEQVKDDMKERISLLEAALRGIRDAMPGTDDAADRVQRLISKALQDQGE